MRLPESREEIEVKVPSYDSLCAALGGGDDVLPRWQELGDVLMRRPGWYFTIDSGAPLWCFGLEGEARLTVEAEMEGFHVFDYLEDESFIVSQRTGLMDWLHEREDKYDGLTATALSLRSFLRRSSETWRPR